MVRPVPLRRSLFLQFFGMSVLLTLAVMLIVTVVMLRSLIGAAERETAVQGVAVRNQIEAQLASRQSTVEVMAVAFARQPDAAARERFMRLILRLDDIIDGLYVISPDGIVEQAVLGPKAGLHASDMLGLDLASRPFFQAARGGTKTVWSDTFLSTLTGRVTAVLAVPSGPGVLLAELSLLSLSKSVSELAAPTEDLIVVLDSQGRIIAHPDAALAARQVNARDIGIVREAIAGRELNGRFVWEGTEYLGNVSRIGRTGWTVLAARQSGRVYSQLLQLAWALAAGLALSLVGALAGALVLSRKSEQRYRRLIEAADNYAQAKQPPKIEFDILEFDKLWRNLRHLFEQIERRDAETRAARAQLQHVFDATTEVSIVGTDAGGSITVFNRGAEKLFGYTAEAMVGRSVLSLHDDGELKRRADELSARLGRPVEGFDTLVAVARQAGYEVRDWAYVRHDGTRLSVSVAFTALRNGQSEPAGYLAVATDLSEHHRAAGLELARQVAEAANQSKSEFLSRVSHDLRTPLNAIVGFAQLLAMDTTEPLTKLQRERVALIETAGWHLVRLIDDVLDLSRIESGNLRVSMEAVDLIAAIRQAVRLVSAQASGLAVTISQPVQADVEAERVLGWADKTRLIQVLVNVLSNAIKYNTRGGQVGITLDASDPTNLDIEISDTGRGMSEAQLARLFEPFNRLGMEGGPIEGTGIGLVIVRRLLDLMDASIGVRSEVGAGTRMRIRIRRSTQPQTIEEAPVAVGERMALENDTVDVVCVEDNATNSQLMQQVFALRPRCRLHLASAAESGMTLIRRLRPRLVMLDLHLPDGSGQTLLERVRLDPELAATPVIVVSADATQHSWLAAQNAGMQAFLSKPIQITQALQEIDAALGGP